ncbi:MAG: SRPBCC family protein [Actinomycetota bacterium]
MADIRVSIVIDASPEQVWSVVERVEDHVDWMADAEAIRFLSDQRQGVGTSFECDTKVGPARLTDIMEITEWVDTEVMGVKHTGIVTGSGRFTLTPAGPGRTEFRWEESLDFPLWMGGPLRDPVGGRILEAIWRRNLKKLKEIVEATVSASAA